MTFNVNASELKYILNYNIAAKQFAMQIYMEYRHRKKYHSMCVWQSEPELCVIFGSRAGWVHVIALVPVSTFNTDSGQQTYVTAEQYIKCVSKHNWDEKQTTQYQHLDIYLTTVPSLCVT